MFQNELYRVKLDGRNHSSFPARGSVINPSCIAVDSVSRHLYYGSQSTSSIELVSLDADPFLRRLVILTSNNYTVASPVDIAVDPINGFALLLLYNKIGLQFPFVTSPSHYGARSMLSVCLYACMYVCLRSYLKNVISGLHQIFSVCCLRLLWWHCNTLCLSGFVDDVIFP